MRRGTALALTFATSIVVTASACGGDASSESSSGGTSSSSGGSSGSSGSAADGGPNITADGSNGGSEGGSGGTDGSSPDGSSEAGGDASSGGTKWQCSDKTRSYQNATACQNAHGLLCQPAKAGVDDGLPCPSLGEIYITCGACNAQDDFLSRECLCM